MKSLGSRVALALVGVSSVMGTVALLPTSAVAEIPMRISQAEEMFMLTVPDKDTTKSAYGGNLRRYDVHVARMVEITEQICRDSSGGADAAVLWDYRAGNGSINMGTFRVTCENADSAMMIFGTEKNQRVTINRSSEGVKDSVVMMVPVLNLSTEAKVLKWQSITTRFKPIR